MRTRRFPTSPSPLHIHSPSTRPASSHRRPAPPRVLTSRPSPKCSDLFSGKVTSGVAFVRGVSDAVAGVVAVAKRGEDGSRCHRRHRREICLMQSLRKTKFNLNG